MTAGTSAGRPSVRSSRYALVVGGGIVLAIALVVGAGILAEAQASEHARLHAGVALAVLLVAAAVLRVRPRPSIASRAPVIGLVLFAAAQLVESVGALGYGPDNETRRNGLVVAHDIGSVATGIALLALVVAVAIATGAVVASRTSRGIVVPILVVLGIIAIGLFLVARMMGI
jgi:hypothetical protein